MVGGNCIVISSPSVSVMLDQGVNFSQLKRFYGLTIQPGDVAELREMGVLPPVKAYEGVEEVYVTHLHLDHLGSLNVPGDTPVYLPSSETAEALSHAWWFGWKKHLLPKTLSFSNIPDIEDSKRVEAAKVSHSAYPSYAVRVDTDDTSILYTGDLRVEPVYPGLANTLESLGKLAEDGVDVLIVEGSNFGRRTTYLTPPEFTAVLSRVLAKYDRKLFFVSAHPLDLEATLATLELVRKHGYTPVFVGRYYARLLDKQLETAGVDLEEELLLAIMRTTDADLTLPRFRTVYISELKERKLAVFIPPHNVKAIRTFAEALDTESGGLLHVTVLGEPLSEEWVVEEKKVENWLEIMGVTSIRLHVSGHYMPHEFKDIVGVVMPKKIIPIHTKAPNTMLALFKNL